MRSCAACMSTMTRPRAFSARMKVPATWARARPSGHSPRRSPLGARRGRRAPAIAAASQATRIGLGDAQRHAAGHAQRAVGQASAAAQWLSVVAGRRRRRRAAAGARGAAHAGAGTRERRADRLAHRLVHLARIAKAHLDLGRMDVDVDALRRDLDEQQVGRLAAAVQDVVVGGAHGVRDQLVAHVAAVDVHVLQVGAGARRLGRAGAAARSPGRRGRRRRRGCARRRRRRAARRRAAAGARARPARDRLAVVPDARTRARAGPARGGARPRGNGPARSPRSSGTCAAPAC